jgi:hypothetical protein
VGSKAVFKVALVSSFNFQSISEWQHQAGHTYEQRRRSGLRAVLGHSCASKLYCDFCRLGKSKVCKLLKFSKAAAAGQEEATPGSIKYTDGCLLGGLGCICAVC